MGQLDDAIREHLELKRRRGADASEIARLEREALGPVRREPFEPLNEDSATGVETDDDAVGYERPEQAGEATYEEYYEEQYYDEEAGDDWGEPFADDVERPSSRRSTSDPPATTSDRPLRDRAPEPEPERRPRRWKRSRRESAAPEEALPTHAEPPADAPSGDETVEYGIDEALPARERRQREPDHPLPDEEGDVLEETPEFLQDAPEHDRLWFEQRPPRDFDFDD